MMKNKRKYFFMFLIIFLLAGCSERKEIKPIQLKYQIDHANLNGDKYQLDGSIKDENDPTKELEVEFYIDGIFVDCRVTQEHRFSFDEIMHSGKLLIELKYHDEIIYQETITYYKDVLDELIDTKINRSMSEYEMMKVFIDYALSFPYNYEINNYQEMIEMKSGECFANSDLLIELCKRVGIKATCHTRNNDLQYPDFHVNVVCLLDHDSYIVDCGHVDRSRYELEKSKGISYRILNDGTISICDLDGYYEVIQIPKMIDGYEVTSIDAYACKDHYETKKIIIPHTVHFIDEHAFEDCIMLDDIECLSDDIKIVSNAFECHDPIMLGNTSFPLTYNHEDINVKGSTQVKKQISSILQAS